MKAVILAAGRGTRLRSATGGAPKCLTSFGERALIDYQIEGLFRAGASRIVVVVGYRAEDIRGHVLRRYADRAGQIAFVTNPGFASTNNMFSLWLARNHLAGDGFVCVNGDVLCHPDILAALARQRSDVCLAVDPSFREETTKVLLRDGRVRALNKGLSREEASGTFVNVASFSSAGRRALMRQAEALFARGRLDLFFNDVIEELARQGRPVDVVETRLPWAEIDDPADLDFARKVVYPELRACLVRHEASVPVGR